MNFFSSTLPNGLQIVAEHRASAASSAIGFFVRTGARDETPVESGVSHFLEHMIFKGTAKRSALDISYQLGAIGAQANAFTSEENTVYYAAILPEYFETALELISDMMRPALDVGEFTTEKKVILEEIALYQDRPTFMLFESTVHQFFKGHDAGNSVLGSNDSITALSRDQMKTYFDRRYAPNNIILAAAGNFSWDRLLELANDYCGGWERFDTDRNVRPHTPIPSEKTIEREGLQVAHMSLVALGPSSTDDQRYAAGVASCILGDYSGSRAFWDLVDPGLADSAHIDAEHMDGTGFVYGYVSAEPDRLEEVGDKLAGIMRTAREFSQDDLDRAKTKLMTRLVFQGESTMRRLMAIGMNWQYRQAYTTLEEEIEKIRSVSKTDIDRVLSAYPFDPVCKVRLIPKQ